MNPAPFHAINMNPAVCILQLACFTGTVLWPNGPQGRSWLGSLVKVAVISKGKTNVETCSAKVIKLGVYFQDVFSEKHGT